MMSTRYFTVGTEAGADVEQASDVTVSDQVPPSSAQVLCILASVSEHSGFGYSVRKGVNAWLNAAGILHRPKVLDGSVHEPFEVMDSIAGGL
mmetsp:Transcript_4197/g.8727  ORF Transcript_4197/g.8727 Transcript_4197/m.8727 type:complete len:92 (+) Transcript_4197:3-278(+)